MGWLSLSQYHAAPKSMWIQSSTLPHATTQCNAMQCNKCTFRRFSQSQEKSLKLRTPDFVAEYFGFGVDFMSFLLRFVGSRKFGLKITVLMKQISKPMCACTLFSIARYRFCVLGLLPLFVASLLRCCCFGCCCRLFPFQFRQTNDLFVQHLLLGGYHHQQRSRKNEPTFILFAFPFLISMRAWFGADKMLFSVLLFCCFSFRVLFILSLYSGESLMRYRLENMLGHAFDRFEMFTNAQHQWKRAF